MSYLLMQTDFGGTSAAMIGVAKIVDPNLRIFQLTNTVPKFDVVTAGNNICDVMTYWPTGTVFVSVVDPGVGTERKACVAETGNGYYVVTPDNGILDIIDRKYGIKALREIDQRVNRYKGNEWSNNSDIFHGRDIFAYCGARLASGTISYEEVGPQYPKDQMVTL